MKLTEQDRPNTLTAKQVGRLDKPVVRRVRLYLERSDLESPWLVANLSGV